MAMNVIAEGVETAEQRDFLELMAAMPIRALYLAARCRWKISRSL
jgi:EAL domain-containing protein (putative c-di-GMP-specific phosphodiesterase class I)